MEARITSVYDEGSLEDTPLIGAKGFSVMVERDGKRVLFDTGLRNRYLKHNIENLEIDPESIDAVAISQAHPDNCRALDGFLDMRETPVDVYAPEGLYTGSNGILSRSIGISEENRSKANIRYDDGWVEVFPGITLTPFIRGEKGAERFLVVEGKSLIVISGRGIEGPGRVLDMVGDRYNRKATVFIGAVLLEKAKKPVAEAYATDFESRGCTKLMLNHCTGRDGMTNLRVHLGLKGVDEFYVGTVYEG